MAVVPYTSIKIDYLYEPDDLNPDIKFAIGECIVAWSQVEMFLSMIFNETLSNGPFVSWMGHEVWNSVNGLKIKIDMLDAAINYQTLPLAIKEKWPALSKKVRNQSTKRNEVAHSGIAEVDGKISLVPYITSHGIPKVALSSEQIKERTLEFISLINEVSEFYSAVLNHQREQQQALLEKTCPSPDKVD